jgi:threonine/homoserine/homoserine lactone efflux protein
MSQILNHKLQHYLEGFRLGMVLQFAVGPVCLYILSLSSQLVFWDNFSAIMGVVLADGIYIFFALLGYSSAKTKIKSFKVIRYVGALILMGFAVSLISQLFNGTCNISQRLSLSLHPFFHGFLLTLASPMTILFWGAVFSSKILEKKFSKTALNFFAGGALSSTLIFLVMISGLGNILSGILTAQFISYLNAGIGLFIFYFALRLMIKKNSIGAGSL